MYNYTSGLWTSHPCTADSGVTDDPCPPPLGQHTAVYSAADEEEANGAVYMFGGRGKEGVALNTMWKLDVEAHTWSLVDAADPPVARYDHSAAVLQFTLESQGQQGAEASQEATVGTASQPHAL